MNFANLALALPSDPPPPPLPCKRDDEAYRRVEDRDKAADEAFDRALAKEIEEREGQPTPPPLPLAFIPFMWQPIQVQAAENASADAISEVGRNIAAAFTSPAVGSPSATTANQAPTEAHMAPTPPAPEAPDAPAQPIKLMVEPGLPTVQPKAGEKQTVSLANFPQMVVGQIRTVVRNNAPLTKLDFNITPPHVGPVNLQVSYTQGVVGVQLTALSLQAKQALEGQVNTIQQILTAHNLTPGQIKVVTAVGGRSGANGAGQKGENAGFAFFSGGRRRSAANEDGTVKTT